MLFKLDGTNFENSNIRLFLQNFMSNLGQWPYCTRYDRDVSGKPRIELNNCLLTSQRFLSQLQSVGSFGGGLRRNSFGVN